MVSAWSSAWWARATAAAQCRSRTSSRNCIRTRRPASSSPQRRCLAAAATSMVPVSKGIDRRSAARRQNCWSWSESCPRRPWFRWAATRLSGNPGRQESMCSRAVESAPPEKPTTRVSPGRARSCSRIVRATAARSWRLEPVTSVT